MGVMKTPGVYIVEKNAFPTSVVEVATAVPAFIGYTRKAINGVDSLLNKPFRITSMAEFHSYFGGAPTPSFKFKFTSDPAGDIPALNVANEKVKKIIGKANDAAAYVASIDATNGVITTSAATAVAEFEALANAAKQAAEKAIKNGTEADVTEAKNHATAIINNKTATTAATNAQDAANADGVAEPTKIAILAVVKAVNDAVAAAVEVATITTSIADKVTTLAADKKITNTNAKKHSMFVSNGTNVIVDQDAVSFTLYYHMMMFFSNGGGPCYIVSVGDYESTEIDQKSLTDGIDTLLKEQEPTMLVCPEAVGLVKELCSNVQQAMLRHCGEKMRSRVAILDVFDGYKDLKSSVIDDFRNDIGGNFMDFGSAYYPWLNTSVVQDRDFEIQNFDLKSLKDSLEKNVMSHPEISDLIERMIAESNESSPAEAIRVTPIEMDTLHKALLQISPIYAAVLTEAKRMLNLLPPSAAMAGIYTMTDNTRGVWKAPANVTVGTVISPTVNITHDEQENLNVHVTGKSINAIRAFVGEGIKVWGARTLDGNSLDWRYINVRRTMIMLEQSVKNASRAYVFEPNLAGTWINVKSMIQNFLTGIWKRGGLAGASPDDAFQVNVGLGETMTSEDVLEGIMRVTVLVALVHPAEFIEITFQQQMQKS